MGRQGYRPDQIIGKLREAGVALAEGQTVVEVVRTLGITEQTNYRWHTEDGGLKVEQAKRLKDLERENARLKRAVADLTLDKLALQEAAEGYFYAQLGGASASHRSAQRWASRSDGRAGCSASRARPSGIAGGFRRTTRP